MVTVRHFKEVIKWQAANPQGDNLHIYGNNQVDTITLAQIARSGEWSKLESVDGFFAAVYETVEKGYLFCDRLGVYPLFYCAGKNAVYASPSLSKMLRIMQHSPKYHTDGVISLLLFGHHLADETVFEGIKRCSGGQTIVITKTGDVEERIVWKKKHLYQDKRSIETNDLAELFVKQVEKNIDTDGKVFLALSDGFDSRAVLGAVLECVESRRIHTLTFGGKDSYDLRIARFVAKKAGVENTVFPITDQIFSDSFLRQRADDYGYSYSAFATQPQKMISYLSREVSKGNVSL